MLITNGVWLSKQVETGHWRFSLKAGSPADVNVKYRVFLSVLPTYIRLWRGKFVIIQLVSVCRTRYICLPSTAH